uniref:Uncharacterized protein n=1 Tax=Arundo donax TaxID=35708 RepID=A0A0A8Y7G5_ARUDO
MSPCSPPSPCRTLRRRRHQYATPTVQHEWTECGEGRRGGGRRSEGGERDLQILLGKR